MSSECASSLDIQLRWHIHLYFIWSGRPHWHMQTNLNNSGENTPPELKLTISLRKRTTMHTSDGICEKTSETLSFQVHQERRRRRRKSAFGEVEAPFSLFLRTPR